MLRISKSSNFIIQTLEADNDHLHFLIESIPSVSITSIVRKLKQESTVSVWKIFFPFLQKHFWNEKTFWTDGYFVSSIGQVSEKAIKEYIQNQG